MACSVHPCCAFNMENFKCEDSLVSPVSVIILFMVAWLQGKQGYLPVAAIVTPLLPGLEC